MAGREQDQDDSDYASDDGVLVYTPPETELDDDVQALLQSAAKLDLDDKNPAQAVEDEKLAVGVSNRLNEEHAGQAPEKPGLQGKRGGRKRNKAKKAVQPPVQKPIISKKAKKAKNVVEQPKQEAAPPKENNKTKRTTVVGAWEDYFGNQSNLANWQRLCADVEMEEIPTSITQCRKALGKVWVNIYDFLDAKAEGKPIKKYESERKLATYTMNSGKIYPKKHAKEGGPAKVLLAHIFSH